MERYSTESASRSDEPFLQDDMKVPRAYSGRVTQTRIWQWAQRAVILLLCIICVVQTVLLRQSQPRDRHQVYSPAQHVVQYEDVVFTSGFGLERSEYIGTPTPERDALWDSLYSCQWNTNHQEKGGDPREVLTESRSTVGVSRIPRDSASRLVNKTVPIPNDPGYYVVELNVFHQLHCLNMIRKRLYSTEDFAPDHQLMGIEHLEHCYDDIRQSLMCNADITPLPWTWVEEEQASKEVARVAHTCRDYAAIKQWAIENRIKHFDTSVYVPDDLRA